MGKASTAFFLKLFSVNLSQNFVLNTNSRLSFICTVFADPAAINFLKHFFQRKIIVIT